MFRRNKPGGGDGGSEPEEVFLGLRSNALGVDPTTHGIRPTIELPRVHAFVMDITGRRTGTIAAFADGTTSLYTSSGGGGILGGGGHEFVVRANRQLLLSAEANLVELADTGEPALPGNGRARLTAVTYEGLRSVEAAQEDLGYRRHPASAMFYFGDQVITELKKVDEAMRANTARAGSAEDGLTRLAWAVRGRDARLVAYLLELGDEVNGRDRLGYTALMFAAATRDTHVVTLLLERGADPNAATELGRTALMAAAQLGRPAAISVLLDAGADPAATDSNGHTALACAEQAGHTECADLLR